MQQDFSSFASKMTDMVMSCGKQCIRRPWFLECSVHVIPGPSYPPTHVEVVGQGTLEGYLTVVDINVSFKAWLCWSSLSHVQHFTPLQSDRLSSCLSGRWLGFDFPVWLQACRPGCSKHLWVGIHEPCCLQIFPSSILEDKTQSTLQPSSPQCTHVVFHAWLVFKCVV